MEYDPSVFGYVNGKPVYSRNEYVYAARHFGAIDNDAELLAYAEKVSLGWYDAGWHRSFTGFYLSDYALAEPYASLTHTEFARLKELQAQARAAAKAADDAREWRYVETVYWADNSIEEIWEDKDGCRKTVTVTGPHGDAC
jgi:hypothetical protein